MSIKLIDVCKRLNIDFPEIIRLCEKAGMSLSIDSNAKIDIDTYILILKELTNLNEGNDIVYTHQVNVNKQDEELYSPYELCRQYNRENTDTVEIFSADDLNLQDIKLDCTFEEYSYKELLSMDEWKTMRNKILKRDNFQCTQCGTTKSLHVHHLYYIEKHLPWEYSYKALVTLCAVCHRALHAVTKVPIYDCDPEEGKTISIIQYDTCCRCDGKGFISKYAHVEDGICYNCWGSGYKHFYKQCYTKADIVDFIKKKMKVSYMTEETDLPF